MMTEYEMASLHSALFVQAQSSLATFLTVLSGTLAVSYLAAHRVTVPMIAIGLFVFVWFATFNITGSYRTLESYSGLAVKMRAFAEAGRGLDWHSAAAIPAWLTALLPLSVAVGAGVSAVAAIAFFFHCRRVNKKAEAGTWRARVQS